MPRFRKNIVLSFLLMVGAAVSFIQTQFEPKHSTERSSRLRRLRDTCSKPEIRFQEKLRIGGTSPSFMKPKHFQYFIVDDANKIIYCYVSKAGNTHWKAIMAVLGGAIRDKSRYNFPSLEDVPIKTGSVIHEPYFFKKLSDFKMGDILSRLEDQSYKIFTFVRHPYARILSAYKDKFSLENAVVRRKYDQLYGDFIFKKYQNEDKSESEPGYKVSWPAFARYLADPSVQDLNEHWDLQHKICNPCQVAFDAIGKIENADDDAVEIMNYLSENLKKVRSTSSSRDGLKTLRYFPAYPNSVDVTELKKYFSLLPQIVLDRLYTKYKLDFEIFGYDPVV